MKGPEYANTVLENILMVTRGWRRWEINDRGMEFSFGSNENVLELDDN